jgi:hyperosmotically inducible protein
MAQPTDVGEDFTRSIAGMSRRLVPNQGEKSMKMKSAVISALVAAGATLVAVPVMARGDSDIDHSHPKAFVKDSAITIKVKAKLADDHLTSMAKIHVDTDDDGVVWLTGTTHSREAAERAVAIARSTEHVKDVHSDIVVRHDD